MFGWEFPPYNSGGLGVACLGLLKALSQQGVAVTFVLPKQLNVRSRFGKIIFGDTVLALPNVTIYEVPPVVHPYTTSAHFWYNELGIEGMDKAAMYGSNLFEEVRRYGEQARLIARREVHDLIHAHDWLSFIACI